MDQKIELRKTRDFGEVIGDTFIFIKQNWKPLLKAYLVICGFFVVASLLVSILNQTKMMGFMNDGFTPANMTANRPFGMFRMFGIEYFLTLFFSLISFIALNLTTLCFVALYRDKNNVPPNVEEVWSYFKFYFFRATGSTLLLWLGICVGFVLCIAPGVYILPAFSLVIPIIVFENATLGYAFSRAFEIIKNNFWTTLGVIVVSAIIVSVAVTVLALPLSILSASSLLFGEHKFNSTYLILTTVVSHICYAFYMLPSIAISLSYFSLTEEKDGTGLLDRINHLGNTDQINDQFPSEEY